MGSLSSDRTRTSVAALAAIVLLVAGLTGSALALTGCKKKQPLTVKPPAETTQTAEEVTPPAPAPVWPFTGRAAEGSDAATQILRRPLSIKIENSALARPQLGIARADIIYETIAEGGITRFNCLFQSDIPKEVGPVRSARLSDMWIVPQYGDGLFFFSGSNSQVRKRIKHFKLADMSHGKIGTALYHRVSFRHAPHNLYLTTSKAYQVAGKKGFALSSDTPSAGLAYQPADEPRTPSSAETTATSLTVPFSPYFKMTWKWNEKKQVWLRSTNGKKQRDAETDKQIAVTNVVVLWAQYTPQKKKDPAGNGTYDITLGGQGKAAVFVGGKRIDGTWTADRDKPPVLADNAGNEIKLDIGKTWFEVPPTTVKIKSTGA